ncbi:MAG TPA: hypothetical protein VNK95_07285 [Caldilineaceae bacterium]|nr:hypothetical protein [Caldilineaceae bacterium]
MPHNAQLPHLPASGPCARRRSNPRRARGLLPVCLLAIGLGLAACGGDETPTPVAPTSAPEAEAAAAISPLSTAAGPTSTPAGAPSDTPADTPSGQETAPPDPTAEEPSAQASLTEAVGAQPIVTATAVAAQATPDYAPLEVDEGTGCEIESDLDLVGYPDLEERMGCPVSEARFDAIGINEFGDLPPYDRFMLWFSHEKQIYVLFADGTYEVFPDTWEEGRDPTFSCNPLGGEPDSPPLPRRGFGKLWCSDPAIQEAMGTVPREERLCQHAVLQRFEMGRLLACFEDATIRYFRLLDNGAWDVTVQ